MEPARARLLRELLGGSSWVERTREFAGTMRRVTRQPSGLLVVGTPHVEPWHMTAHLADEARLAGSVELAPTLVRWRAPAGAPPHLAVTLQRLEVARRGETLLVVAEETSPDPLLERVDDVRRRGATVLAIDGGDAGLESLAHDAISVPAEGLGVPAAGSPGAAFETVEHLVTLAVGETPAGRRGLRDRLARLLDAVGGPGPDPEA